MGKEWEKNGKRMGKEWEKNGKVLTRSLVICVSMTFDEGRFTPEFTLC